MAELQKSLHTADAVEAKRRCLAATAWFQNAVERLRGMSSPTRSDLEAAARAFFSGLADGTDRPRSFPREEANQGIAWNVHLSTERIAELDDQLRANDYDGEVRKLATAMLASLGIPEPDLDSIRGVQAQQLAARAVRQQMASHALDDGVARLLCTSADADGLQDRRGQGCDDVRRVHGDVPVCGALGDCTLRALRIDGWGIVTCRPIVRPRLQRLPTRQGSTPAPRL